MKPTYEELVIDIVCTYLQGKRLRAVQEHPATEYLIGFAEEQCIPASTTAHHLVDLAS
jgi:hypothetical protein